MLYGKYELSRSMHDSRAGFDGKGLANGFATDGEARDKSGHHKTHHSWPGEFEVIQDLGRDGCRSGSGHDAADIADHVIADGADTLSIAQKTDRLLGTGYLAGSHGMEGLFVSGCDRDANNIKDDTDQDDAQKDKERNRHAAARHDFV